MRKSALVRGAEAAERQRRLIQLRGVSPNGHPIWTPPEKSPFEVLGPAYGVIQPMLDRRTPLSLRSKAWRMGVTYRRRSLSEDQVRLLKRIYPHATHQELLQAFSGWSIKAIRAAANRRGYRRAPKPLEVTGNRLLDQILSRAKRNNYSLRDLDAMCRSKSYWQRRRWRTHPDEVIHCRAVRLMGGVLRAEFK